MTRVTGIVDRAKHVPMDKKCPKLKEEVPDKIKNPDVLDGLRSVLL